MPLRLISILYNESLIHYGENNEQSFLNKELSIIEGLLNGIISEKGNWGSHVEGFEKISWPPEEAMFLRAIENFDLFYDEVYKVLTPVRRDLINLTNLISPVSHKLLNTHNLY